MLPSSQQHAVTTDGRVSEAPNTRARPTNWGMKGEEITKTPAAELNSIPLKTVRCPEQRKEIGPEQK